MTERRQMRVFGDSHHFMRLACCVNAAPVFGRPAGTVLVSSVSADFDYTAGQASWLLTFGLDIREDEHAVAVFDPADGKFLRFSRYEKADFTPIAGATLVEPDSDTPVVREGTP